MTYKTILTFSRTVEEAAYTVPVAVDLAKQFDAHLVGIYAIPLILYAGVYGATIDTSASAEAFRDYAKKVEAATRQAVEREANISFEWYAPQVSDSRVTQYLVTHARHADLVVTNAAEDVPGYYHGLKVHEAFLMSSGRPVLMVPEEGGSPIGKSAVVGWNGGRAAARAVFDALPLLKKSPEVEIVRVSSDAHQYETDYLPNAEIAKTLARHGLSVETVRDTKSKRYAGEELLKIAKLDNCGYLVMGGYGHSRFRESILGGTTKYILKHARLPVLFSH